MEVASVSVIIPSFNKGELLRETLDSVLEQRGVELEVILIDDASTDGSWDIATEYAGRITAKRLPRNRGGPHARNVGAEIASGEYLMFLDADDLLDPGTLLALTDALGTARRSRCVAACAWRQLHAVDGEWAPLEHTKPLLPADGDLIRAWLNDNWYFPPCAVLWPRAVYESTGGWDEELRVLQDADLMIRALILGVELVVAGGGQSWYRVHAAGASVSKVASGPSVRSRLRFLDNTSRELGRAGLLERYQVSLARAYYDLGRTHAAPYPELATKCIRRADRLAHRAPFSGTRIHRFLWRVLGLERKERVTRWLRRAPAAEEDDRGGRAPLEEKTGAIAPPLIHTK